MIVEGGETVTVVGDCRFCGEGASGRLGTKCEACDRQRHRLSKIVSPVLERGLTICCGLLPHVARGRYYCAACPGTGKVAVVLVHGGREITAYHLPETPVEQRLTVASLAERRGVAADELALRITTARSFGLRRLRDVDPRDLRATYVDSKFRCASCGDSCTRSVRRSSVTHTKLCSSCAERSRHRSQRNGRAHERRKVAICVECGSRSKIESDGRCCACSRRLSDNGRHACGAIMGRFRGRPVCKACEPTSAYRARPVVSVTITDGRDMRTIYVSQNTPLCGVRARALVAPMLLVDDVHKARQFLSSVRLVSGLAVPHTGAASRSLLPVLERASDLEAAATAAAGEGMARAALIQLRRAGLVDEHGLTSRAKAVLAWCRSAGVRL